MLGFRALLDETIANAARWLIGLTGRKVGRANGGYITPSSAVLPPVRVDNGYVVPKREFVITDEDLALDVVDVRTLIEQQALRAFNERTA